MSENKVFQTMADHSCAQCGVVYAMTTNLENARRKDHGTFYCPNGHGQSYPKKTTKTPSELQVEIDSLKKENGELRTKNIRLSAQIDQLEAQLAEGPKK